MQSFERETNREKNLEKAMKEAKIKARKEAAKGGDAAFDADLPPAELEKVGSGLGPALSGNSLVDVSH